MEIYIKVDGDPNYDPEKVHIEDEIQQLITQIETVLFTRRGDVLGSPDFGCNLEDMLFTFGFAEYKIRKEIRRQFNAYVPLTNKHNVTIKISFEKGNTRDIGYIDIMINNTYSVSVRA
jgi:phage baseplate assembly protein W